jgi:predicted nucleic acid-binding protein
VEKYTTDASVILKWVLGDVAYLAVAYEVDSILVTADEAFVRKTGKTSRLCLLKDLDLE